VEARTGLPTPDFHRWAWHRASATGGTRTIETFPQEQIKRVRVVRRADGYCVQAERQVEHQLTGKQLGVDVGLASFTTDSGGMSTPNPRYLRQSETKLKRLHRRCRGKRTDRKTERKPGSGWPECICR